MVLSELSQKGATLDRKEKLRKFSSLFVVSTKTAWEKLRSNAAVFMGFEESRSQAPGPVLLQGFGPRLSEAPAPSRRPSPPKGGDPNTAASANEEP